MDFVVQVHDLPKPGQTILGDKFQTIPGGKGANQAVAAGKLAGLKTTVAMAGCVGMDSSGEQLKASLASAGVDIAAVQTLDGPSGIALISIDRNGQNSIIVAPGANAKFQAESVYDGAAYALFQLETPLDQVETALQFARKSGAVTILDPAPAQPLAQSLLEQIDILTPNETEAAAFAGDSANPDEIANRILGMGPRSVVLKLGAEGCFYSDGRIRLRVDGIAVKACDTVAAGDCFNGALAVALAEGTDIETALRFANAAAAISVTRPGAQPSMPSREEVEEFLR